MATDPDDEILIRNLRIVVSALVAQTTILTAALDRAGITDPALVDEINSTTDVIKAASREIEAVAQRRGS